MAAEDDVLRYIRRIRPQAEIGLADPTGELPVGGPSLPGLFSKAVQLELPLPVAKPRFDPNTAVDFTRQTVPHETGYLYHATNTENARDIADEGYVRTYPPDYGTDQSEWPDRGLEDRSYWAQGGSGVSIFAPEGGRPVLLRTKQTPMFNRESGTGDYFTREPVHGPEYFTSEGWRRLGSNRNTPTPANTNEEMFTPQQPDRRGVSYFLTPQQKQRLAELGFPSWTIAHTSPEQARDIIMQAEGE